MKSRKGFTLIELLVVIAIIALLMSIIVPAIRKAKMHARTVICKTNLKQYGLGMGSYLADNEGAYPYAANSIYNDKTTNYIPCQWHDEDMTPERAPENAGPLWPYLSSMDAHLCPSFKSLAEKYGEFHPGHQAHIPMEPQYSYSQNYFLGSESGVLKESGVQRSSAEVALFVEETIWFLKNDAGDYVADHVLNDTTFLSRHPADSVAGDSVATYHKDSNVGQKITGIAKITQTTEGGMGNVVFIDGHVELVDPFEYQEGLSGSYYKSYLISYPKRGAMAPKRPY